MASERMKVRIETFKMEVERAKEKGIEIRPSVDGPYAYDPRAGVVIGRKGSEGYRLAVAESPATTDRERKPTVETELQSLFEKWAFLQGFDISKSDGTYNNPKTVAAMMGYYAATKRCKEVCIKNALYYVDGSSSAAVANRCADDIGYN